MKIGLRILLGYFLVVGLAAWFLLNVFVEQVKPGVRYTLEDTLADTAQLLAVLVAADVKAGMTGDSAMLARIDSFAQRNVALQVNGFDKRAFNYRVYITNERGIVIFDSRRQATGQDYSRWNDVYLTLRGQYGARITREREQDDASAVIHVAAPVMDGDTIIGVLSVAKPISTVQPFVDRSERIILQRGALLLALSLLIGVAFAWWLTHALRKLMLYIADVEAGRKSLLPALGNNEIGTLGRALEAMRTKLEGKQYVEELMHTLAHELKSPIAAIQGSAELMQEEMPAAERRHFLGNILNQNARQKQLIDKLLALVRVEKQQHLDAPERIALRALMAQAQADLAPRLAARSLSLASDIDDIALHGDALLLRQAIGNLLDNAADFTPEGSTVHVTATQAGNAAVIAIRDSGAGIPDYAQARLFERFYSLPRPDGAKSTGLGLPFVREVMALHRGTVEVGNDARGGACATLSLPVFAALHTERIQGAQTLSTLATPYKKGVAMQKALLIKILVIFGLMLLIAIPLAMIDETISERDKFREQAVASIAADSVREQTVAGPVLVVPYTEEYEEMVAVMAAGAVPAKTELVKRRIERRQFIFPNELQIDGRIDTGHRYRGIHKVLVYSGTHGFKGDFVLPPAAELARSQAHSRIAFGKPFVALAIDDVRGIRNAPSITLDGKAIAFRQGSGLASMKSGVHADLGQAPAEHARLAFSFELRLDGIERQHFVPLGRNNHVSLASNWPHPQFGGRFLPLTAGRSITKDGFKAAWDISSLATDAQAQLVRAEQPAQAEQKLPAFDRFSVGFIEPVNVYSMAERATKYGFLFVALTFAAFFLFETLKRLPVHPIQYLLVGLALALFFLLLVSLSEHIDFALAYVIASSACILLIGFYLAHVLRERSRGVGFGAALALLYSALYGLLISESNALVLGSLLLFVLLAAVMVATRKVDWYQVGKPDGVQTAA